MTKLVHTLWFMVYGKLPVNLKPITHNQSGQILVIVFVALGVVLFSVLSIVAGAQIYFQNAQHSIDAEKATALAEAALDKAVASLNQTGGNFDGEEDIPLGEGTYSINITSPDAATKLIEATGFIPNKDKAKVKRTVKITASRGTGVSFMYGIQVGEGGLELGNGNLVKGSIYSNGNIEMGENNTVTGDAWVAAGVPPTANQQTECQTCVDFLFGRSIEGQTRLDIAQSFKPSITDKIRKISIMIKKIGPGPHSDLTVRIIEDSGGKPGKTPSDILATGTLNNQLVTENYGFIDVTFSTNPTLSAENTYWIMVDTLSNDTNYWSWQNDSAASYNRGQPKWSPNWSAGSPVWNDLTGGPNLNELSFKVYMGGTTTSLSGGNHTKVLGDAHANTIDDVEIGRDAYYQSISDSTVSGSSCPNEHCHPGSEDPPPQNFPISEANIIGWKNGAEEAGSLSQPICGSEIAWGPGKYTGTLTLGNSCVIKVKTPIWITGDLNMGNENRFIMDSSYGGTSGVIILGSNGISGKAVMGNQNKLMGSGVGNSILVLLSTYDTRTNDEKAISLGNVGNSGVFYADKGTIDPGNSNQFKEITAWKIKLTNESTIDYETGLASILFSSGPAGSYSLVKGTYQVK